eukprot:GHVL01024131.1.p1 GENE.GHVL01024131.1~~GHVL01024131.1.p1  ORF type:complete len:219 (+),score=29.31 GHVL01024131.1:410-1066(+)
MDESLLSCFDFASLDGMDPALAVGHKVIYDRECPFELRLQDDTFGPQDVGTLEAIKCKILLLSDGQTTEEVRIELTSENDLFFHFSHAVDEKKFRQMKASQKLMIEFSEYSHVVKKMLNSCIKEPQSFLAVFVMHKDGQARLDFIQNMEYKFVELLSCEFRSSPNETVRQQIAFRYNTVKSKLNAVQNHLQELTVIVKTKNPSLLLQLQKPTKTKKNT